MKVDRSKTRLDYATVQCSNQTTGTIYISAYCTSGNRTAGNGRSLRCYSYQSANTRVCRRAVVGNLNRYFFQSCSRSIPKKPCRFFLFPFEPESTDCIPLSVKGTMECVFRYILPIISYWFPSLPIRVSLSGFRKIVRQVDILGQDKVFIRIVFSQVIV